MRHPSILHPLSSILSLLALLPTARAADPGTLNITPAQPTTKIGPLFYGLMTEEINHAYDGGLYAELIQNRIFQDNPDHPTHWSIIQDGNASQATITIDQTNPVNTTALTRSLRLDITAADPAHRAALANDGFWGIPVHPNTQYHASFYARAASGFTGPLTVSIESNDGQTTFATATLPSITTDWKKYETTLTTPQDAPTSTTNRFTIAAHSKGTVYFSLVSLFPPTYHDRPNGLRIDLMEKLAALHPKFLRFPGGNYLEGNTIDERFDWKKTIGPLENRPGHQCPWGYRSSDGLGLLEFLTWCQDLHMQPLLAVYAGYSLRGQRVAPGPDLQPFVQDALDEIQYCTADTNTTWGARRAQDGHPAPFDIHYVEVGNEDFFDRQPNSYDGRFAQFYDAIKHNYPNLQVIATTPVHSRKPDLVDDHDYPSAAKMLRTTRRYDHRDPSLPKVFFGEWATREGRPTPTFRAALADAAWMIGLQRDADSVLMNCYAPLFVNVNPGAFQWSTNLIGYDAAHSFGSTSYYAQQMFSTNLGDTNLATEVVPAPTRQSQPPAPQGAIGLGTWNTAAEYKDVTVTAPDGKTLFSSDFSHNLQGWTPTNGTWTANDGAATQSAPDQEDTRLLAGDKSWTDYTLTLKARKTAGREGFIILFHVKNDNDYLWLNLGGWNNSRSGLEESSHGARAELGPRPHFTIQPNRWYDIKIQLAGPDIKCYVDNHLLLQATDLTADPPNPLYALASHDAATNDIILKVVNIASEPQPLQIHLQNTPIAPQATLLQLTGQPTDSNTLTEPTQITPTQSTLQNLTNPFPHTFPPHSISVLRLKPQ